LSDDLLVELRDDGVLVATFNRPEQMNALGGGIGPALTEVLGRATHDEEVRALVITGHGRAFCAGAEITLDRDPTVGAGSHVSRFHRTDQLAGAGRMAIAFAEARVPIIAALNGFAVGAGFGLALCCDVRIAAESARLGPIFIKRGLSSDYGASYWLPRIVGIARAYELFYDGTPIEAARALELGLVNRVVPDEQLLDEALAYASRVAAGPPLGYARVRQLLARSLDTPIRDYLELEWAYQADLLRTQDAREGFRAFVERRDPEFSGS